MIFHSSRQSLRSIRLYLSLASLALVACGESTPLDDTDSGADAAVVSDASTNEDATTADATSEDAASEDATVDAAPADPCVTNNGGCEQVCTQTDGDVTCACEEGFLLDQDGASCAPECLLSCGTNATCVFVEDAPTCACDDGTQDNDGDDDCAPSCTPTTCGTHATCEDESGTATCACDQGTSDPDEDLSCDPDCSELGCAVTDTCVLMDVTPHCLCDTTLQSALYGGTASAGPGEYGQTSPSDVFDGNTGSQFNAIVPNVTFLAYDYGAGQTRVIEGYTLHAYASDNSLQVSFQLEGSNDGTSYTVLDAHTQTMPINQGPLVFRFANTTGYRYYRLNFPGFSQGFVRVQELAMTSCPVF